MDSSKSNRQYKTIIFISIILTLWSGKYYYRLGILNFDQLVFSNVARQGFHHYKETLLEFLLKHHERPNLTLIPFSFLDYLIDDKLFYSFFIFCSLIFVSIAVAYFVFQISKNTSLSIVTSLLTFLFIQISMEPIALPTAYVGSYVIPLIFLFLSFSLLIKFLKYKKKYLYICSVILFISCLFSYELFILYLPIIYLISYVLTDRKLIQSFKIALPYLVSSLAYLLLYIIVKINYNGVYEGSKVTEKFDFYTIFNTLKTLTMSSIPGYFLFNESTAYFSPLTIYKNSMYHEGSYEFFLENYLDINLLCFSLLFYLVITILLKRVSSSKFTIKQILLMIFISLVYWIIPNILYSITPLYQNQVKILYQQSSIGTFFSYIALILIIIFLILLIIKVINDKKYKNYIIIVIGITLTVPFYLVGFSNDKITSHIGIMYKKWEIVDDFITSEEFFNVEDGSYIYSPSLFTPYAIMSMPEDYWNNYVYSKVGKKVNFVYDEAKIPNNSKVYYLKYDQFKLRPEQYIIFSQIEDNLNGRIYSNNATIYTLFTFDEWYIIGRVNNSTEVLLNNKQSFNTDNGFQFLIDNSNNNNRVNNLREFTLEGEKLDIDSITIGQATKVVPYKSLDLKLFEPIISNTLMTSKLISGISEDKWTSDVGEIQIRSGDAGIMVINAQVPDIYRSNNIKIYSDGNLVLDKKVEPGQINFELPVKKNAIVQLKIVVEKSFIPSEIGLNGDSRRLGILLNDIVGK